jgi:hypothetical protein
MAGFDMMMLDADPSGCVSVWLKQQGLLDAWRWNVLAECEQRLIRVLPELDAYGREYYQRLLGHDGIDTGGGLPIAAVLIALAVAWRNRTHSREVKCPPMPQVGQPGAGGRCTLRPMAGRFRRRASLFVC